MGSAGLKVLERLGLRCTPSEQTNCTVANGQACSTSGVVKAPICLMGKISVLDILVVPEISSELILGLDFWTTMDVVPDLKRDVWHFGAPTSPRIAGIKDESSLTTDQRTRLAELLR